jgi:hypothetical protein
MAAASIFSQSITALQHMTCTLAFLSYYSSQPSPRFPLSPFCPQHHTATDNTTKYVKAPLQILGVSL